MALPGTNAEAPIDSRRLDGSLWKPCFILSYSEGYFNPPSDLTLTLFSLLLPFFSVGVVVFSVAVVTPNLAVAMLSVAIRHKERAAREPLISESP